MSILKHLSVILVGLTSSVCQAEIAIEAPAAREAPEMPSTSSAAKPEPIALVVIPLRLAITLVDGSHIIGVPRIESIPVQTSYAKMDIPLTLVRSIKIGDDHEGASFELQNGDMIKGILSLKPLELETVFGSITVDVQHIATVSIISTSSDSKTGRHQTIPSAGTWLVTQENGTTFTGVLSLRHMPDQQLVGTMTWENHPAAAVVGKMSGRTIVLTFDYRNGLMGTYRATLSDDGGRLLHGTTVSSDGDSAKWSAVRK